MWSQVGGVYSDTDDVSDNIVAVMFNSFLKNMNIDE
jgi:hypothetical protein